MKLGPGRASRRFGSPGRAVPGLPREVRGRPVDAVEGAAGGAADASAATAAGWTGVRGRADAAPEPLRSLVTVCVSSLTPRRAHSLSPSCCRVCDARPGGYIDAKREKKEKAVNNRNAGGA